MTREEVIVLELEHAKSEIVDIGDVNLIIVTEESIFRQGPARINGVIEMLLGENIISQRTSNIVMKLFEVDHNCCADCHRGEIGSTEGSSELFLCEDRFAILWVNTGVATTSLF